MRRRPKEDRYAFSVEAPPPCQRAAGTGAVGGWEGGALGADMVVGARFG